MLQPGTPVDRYVIQQVLGRGGMATVYRVKHAVLGTQHALKVLHAQGARLHEEIIREGRLQARLDPEFIVPVSDILFLDGSPALLMPLVQGCSLAQLLNNYLPTESETVSIISAVARGVASAHARGIVHRDLKPANILLDVHRGLIRIRVADFGLGIQLARANTTKGFAGTPAYAPPEQLSGNHQAKPEADIWPLGVMIVECLTGERPYPGTTSKEILGNIQADPPNLHEVPPPWHPLLHRLLNPDPTQRGPGASRLPAALLAIKSQAQMGQSGQLAEAFRRVRGAKTISPDRIEDMEEQLEPHAGGQDTFSGLDDEDWGFTIAQHNLPPSRDEFVGRTKELQALGEQVAAGARVLTVLGTGGAGKTRLTLHYARQQLNDRPGGCWFIDLTEASTAMDIHSAAARILGVKLTSDEPEHQIGEALSALGRALVIIDNAEVVAELIPSILATWASMATDVQFICTSRVVLAIPGERTWPIEPLPNEDAVDLFLTRATNAKATFSPDYEEMAAIQQLTQHFDGLPLAIELAAARVRVMSPSKMLKRINDRFNLLSSQGSGNSRHRTLRATIDWSWNLLADWERATLAQLSIFEGGFNLEAAEAVLDLSTFNDAPWTMDAVQALVDKSLVQMRGDDRFGLLSTIQEYGLRRLDEFGETLPVQIRHASHFASFGTLSAMEELYREGGAELIRALVEDRRNFATACSRALAREDAETALACLRVSYQVSDLVGAFEAIYLLSEQLVGLNSASETVRAHGLLIVGRAARLCGRSERAMEALNEAEAGFARQKDSRGLARTTLELGAILHDRGELDEATQHFKRAMHLARENDDEPTVLVATLYFGSLLTQRGLLKQALAQYQSAKSICITLGNQLHEGKVLANIGNLYLQAERYQEAIRWNRSASVANNRIQDYRSEAIAHLNTADAYLGLSLSAKAYEHLKKALPLARRTVPFLAGETLASMAKIEAQRGRVRTAKRHIAEAEPMLRRAGHMLDIARFLAKKAHVDHLCQRPTHALAALNEAEALAARAGGNDRELNREIANARALMNLA